MNTFKRHQIQALIIAAAIGMIALIALQAKWLLHSKNLIEEQFNQKVSMALCMTVTELGQGSSVCAAPNPMLEIVPQTPLSTTIAGTIEIENLRPVLDKNLSLTDIALPYEVNVHNVHDEAVTCGTNSPSCCSLVSVAGFENNFLSISFPNRTQYILGEMGLMIAASIFILLFVSGILWLSIYSLSQQQAIGERNKDFFNNMAHEFRTPLANIQLATRLLGKKAKLTDNNYLSIVHKETKNLSHQVERVLHLSNLEKGTYQLSIETLSVTQLLQEVLDEMVMVIQEKKAIIHTEIPANLTIKGDAFHLKNAFRNLVDNALKYSRQPPVIHISTEQKSDGVLLLFQDNGIGISKANQQIIFDKFQRVGTGAIHNQKGFGLGLAYVKKVIDLHKGMIKIASELGKGSRFDLFLPF